MPWKPLDRIAFAFCTYPFTPSQPQDLPLQIGDELYIIEQGGKDGAWYRGYLVAPPSLLAGLTSTKGQALEARVFSGIFPRDCVEVRELLGDIVSPLALQTQPGQTEGERARDDGAAPAARQRPPAPVPMLKIGDESALAKEEPLVDEITSCLREWHNSNLHELLLSEDYERVARLSVIVDRLDTSRRKLLHQLLTKHELAELRESAVWDLVVANKMLGQDVVVRSTAQKGAILTGDDSAIDVSRLQASMSLLDKRPAPQTDSKSLHHLLLNISSFPTIGNRTTMYSLCLYSKIGKDDAKLVSEIFSIDATAEHKPANLSTRTLFADLSPVEIDDGPQHNAKLYLVIKMVTSEPPRSKAPATDDRDTGMNGVQSQEQSNGSVRGHGTKSTRRSVMWGQQNSRYGRPDTADSASSAENAESSKFQNDVYKAPDKPVKRTTGVGILDVTAIFKSREVVKKDVAIRSRLYPALTPEAGDAELDALLPQIYGDKQPRNYHTVNRITIQLKSFDAPDSDELIQSTPTLLHGVLPTRRIGFARAPTKHRSDIYFTLLSPHIPRGALISHPKFGAEAFPNDIGTENFQLTLEVRTAAGDRIEHCIFPTSNSAGHTAWRTTAVARGEYWNQTIRLSLDPRDVPGCHIIMSIADGYGFPFALAYIPLWNADAFARDGHHALAMYKYDEHTASSGQGKGGYMTLPWKARIKDETVTGPIACLNVGTFLCSTRYSQDPSLLGLLKWKEQGTRGILTILNRFSMVPEIEIVKLLEEVLDAIFRVIVEYGGNEEVEEQAFNALVMTLSVVHDRRFTVQPLVDDYVLYRFHYPFAFPYLVRSFTRLLANPTEPEVARKLRSTCKLGGHLLKFIVKARQQQIEKEVGIGLTGHQPTYLNDLRGIFTGVDSLIKHSDPVVLGTKTLLAQNFHTWLVEIAPYMKEEEVLAIATSFVNALSGAQGKLVLYKLLLLYNVTKVDLFRDEENQEVWRKLVLNSMEPHWGRIAGTSQQFRDQVRLCCSVISIMEPNTLGARLPDILSKLVQSYRSMKIHPRPASENFSPLFADVYPFPTKATQSEEHFDEVLIEIGALLARMTEVRAAAFLDLPKEDLARIIFETIAVQHSLLGGEAFPNTWLSLRIFHYRAMLKALNVIFQVMTIRYLPEPEEAEDFDAGIWKGYLHAIIQLIGSDALVIENFPEQRRRAVWKIGGDLRDTGAALLARSWSALGWDAQPDERELFGLQKLGGFQVSFAPEIIGPIVELCLSVHESLRSAATGVLHSMIASEWALNDSLDVIQAKLIESLDEVFKHKEVNEGMAQKIFIDDLRKLVGSTEKTDPDAFHRAANRLLDTVNHLLELLIPVHSSQASGDLFPVMDALRLMEFYKDIQKEDIYIQYVHQLALLQERDAHHVEAGLAVQMHADLYSWSLSSVVPAIDQLQLPQQTMFERKERLYFDIIRLFEEGLAFRQALAAYTELAKQYEHVLFDFAKLARAQRAMATINERIMKGEQIPSRFFRVIFKGLGFPVSLRDRHFVFEGEPDDRQASFTDRLQKQYPAAQITTGSGTGDLEGQFISIHAVSPQRNLLHPINRRLKVMPAIRDHYMLAEARLFTTTSRRQASTTGVKDQVMEKVIFTAAEPFPNVLGRSEIVNMQTVTIQPVQIGLERTIRKTGDIRGLQPGVSEGDEEAVINLIDELKVLVGRGSPSNVSAYWTLLKDADSVELHGGQLLTTPCADRIEEALRVALIDHVLAIHSSLEQIPSTYSTDKTQLSEDFAATFPGIIATAREMVPSAFGIEPTADARQKQLTSAMSIMSGDLHTDSMRAGSSATYRYTPGTDEGSTTSSEDTQQPSRFQKRLSLLNFNNSNSNSHHISESISSRTAGPASNASVRPVQSVAGSSMKVTPNGRIQARMDSVTKRFSALNFGRKKPVGMVSKPPTIVETDGGRS